MRPHVPRVPEAAGLVERTVNPDDRRSVLVRLTDEGREKVQRMLEKWSLAAIVVVAAPLAAPVAVPSEAGWETGLQQEALALLSDGREDVWDVLSRRFESRLIQTALQATRGRRIEAAQKLGIGRNTITRKIQELGLDALSLRMLGLFKSTIVDPIQ